MRDAIPIDTAQGTRAAPSRTARDRCARRWKAPQPLRQQDGIHFTVPGSRYFANRVAPEIEALMRVDAP